MPSRLHHEAFIFDLDGCIYRGNSVIEGAPEVVEALRGKGRKVLFLTNNSTKTPRQFVEKLARMGIAANDADIMTSSIATSKYLRGRRRGRGIERGREGETGRGRGSCYVVGEEGLCAALRSEGFELLEEGRAAEADYIVCGLDMKVTYEKLAAACVAIQNGAKFIATNADPNLPVEGGYLPGAGSIVRLIEEATGVRPLIIGKPSPRIVRMALERLGTTAGETAMVGDTLNMDIKAGRAAGLLTILVLTGAADMRAVSSSRVKPDIVLDSVAGLSTLI